MIEFWNVENTGSRLAVQNPSKIYDLHSSTRQKNELNQPTTLWRIVHTTIVREKNKEVITRI